jgi:hypothetical protein
MVMEAIGLGYGDQDFASLLDKEARAAGRALEAEQTDVGDGLG